MLYGFILIPFLGLVLINLLKKADRGRAAFYIAQAVLGLEIIFSAILPFLHRKHALIMSMESVFAFNLYASAYSPILLVLVTLCAYIALRVAYLSFQKDDDKFNFANLLLLNLAGIAGLALAADLFSLYVFIEVTTVGSLILISIQRNALGFEGTLKYLVLSAIASVLMLSAIALLLLFSPGLTFASLHSALEFQSMHFLVQTATALFFAGLLIKGGLIPFHGWVADAYAGAPAPVSVFLAGIVTKACGIFPLFILTGKVFPASLALNNLLLFVGALSAVGGALLALNQSNVKRLLAYSSISQTGYIVLGLACGSVLGVLAAVLHFVNHALQKTQMFTHVATWDDSRLDNLAGYATAAPLAAGSFAATGLSVAGLPPLNGFWSKLLIVFALWQTHHFGYATVAALTSVLTLAYVLKIIRKMYSVPAKCAEKNGAVGRVTTVNAEPTPPLLSLVTILAGANIALGIIIPVMMVFWR